MVIGNGMIAKRFESYISQNDIVIFASGVSNSTNAPQSAFKREKKLITNALKTNQDKLFVYFSTCSISDKTMQESAYIKHKKNIEAYIASNHTQYLIFRLTNPVGFTSNTNTVVNFLIEKIKLQQKFDVWQNATRNIIDIDDMFLICDEIIQQKQILNEIINIANPNNYSILYIVECIEKHFAIKGNYSLVNKGDGPVIDSKTTNLLFKKFNINFDETYLPKLLLKYFSN